MPLDYADGKIYSLFHNDVVCYIGSTTTALAVRWNLHWSAHQRKSSRLYRYMGKTDRCNWKIKLVKEYPCQSRQELLKEEYAAMMKMLRDGVVLLNVVVGQGFINEVSEQPTMLVRLPTAQVARATVAAHVTATNFSAGSSIASITEAQRHAADIVLLTTDQQQQAHQDELNSLSANSRAAYLSDKRVLVAWLAEHYPHLVDQLASLTWPICMQWLTEQADTGLSEATIRRRYAFLRTHAVPSLRDPLVEQGYEKQLAGLLRRIHSTETPGKAPLLDVDLERILKALADTTSFDGQQQRVFLLFGWATALRRSEIKALCWRDVSFVSKGVSVHVRQSKTGEKMVAVNDRPGHPLDLRPVLMAWRVTCASLAHERDPVFHSLTKRREMGDRPISARLMTEYIKTGLSLIGKEGTDYAPHSLRSGRITSAAASGASTAQLMGLSRHKSVQSLTRYVKLGVFDHGL